MEFYGTYRASLHPRTGIAIPRSFGELAYLVVVKDEDIWRKVAGEINSRCLVCFAPDSSEGNARRTPDNTYFPDAKRRIKLSREMVDYLGPNSRYVQLVGQGTYFEIWNPDRWKDYSMRLTDERMAECASELALF